MRIIDNVRPDRQTVMFSATFPRQMEALARRILTRPIEVQVCVSIHMSMYMFFTKVQRISEMAIVHV